MLTQLERQFMDLYLREGFTHKYDGHAHQIAQTKEITYDHFMELWPAYKVAWQAIGEWPDHLPPLPPDPHMPCPWESKAAIIARIQELQTELRTSKC